MRALPASSDERARDAVEFFAFRVGQDTAAMAASLDGLDGFAFTGGIGEHGVEVRAMAQAAALAGRGAGRRRQHAPRGPHTHDMVT